MSITKEQNWLMFEDWQGFKEKLNKGISHAITEDELCESVGVEADFYHKVIQFAIRSWRNSTSTSILHAFGKQWLTIPRQRDRVFSTHLMQTRFLMMVSKNGLVSRLSLTRIEDEEGAPIMVGGEYALAVKPDEKEAEKEIDKTLKALYLYFAYCKEQEGKQEFKLPKKLYRGIRIRDIRQLPGIAEAIEQAVTDADPYEKRRVLMVNVIIRYIEENGIQDLCEQQLLSFTSSKKVAEFFASGAGLVLEINTKDAEIATSERHDKRFAQKDAVSGKMEKEYIVRVSDQPQYVANIHIADLDYLVETNNPLAVGYFDHDNKTATYTLHDVKIRASFVWMSERAGRLSYRVDGQGYGMSSREFLRKHGFSPVLTEKTIPLITDFSIQKKR